MSRLNVLISGAGVGGPAAAYWLSKIGAKVTIVERSPSPRKTGQAIDVRGPGVSIMRKMNLEQEVLKCNTTEKGIQKIGSTGKVIATLDSTGDSEHQVMTSEYEIARADMARLIIEALPKDIEIVYGDFVKSIEQRDNKINVTFANGRASSTYDLLVGADGQSSKTRSLLTGRPAHEDLNKGHGVLAYFSMPRTEKDPKKYAQLYTATKGRSILIRPTRQPDVVGCVLIVNNAQDERLEKVAGQGVDEQKQLLADIFRDAGWEGERVCKGLVDADDFYYQREAKVCLDKWYQGRVVLLGDAAHAVQIYGTSAAMLGGYLLAGEIGKNPNNLEEALASYQKLLKPKVDKWQVEPEWISAVMNPQSQLAIYALNGLWQMITGLRIHKLAARFGSMFGADDESVPEYDWPL